jgi:hypothetical protein
MSLPTYRLKSRYCKQVTLRMRQIFRLTVRGPSQLPEFHPLLPLYKRGALQFTIKRCIIHDNLSNPHKPDHIEAVYPAQSRLFMKQVIGQNAHCALRS